MSWATSALSETWAPTPTHQNQDSNSVTLTHNYPAQCVHLPRKTQSVSEKHKLCHQLTRGESHIPILSIPQAGSFHRGD